MWYPAYLYDDWLDLGSQQVIILSLDPVANRLLDQAEDDTLPVWNWRDLRFFCLLISHI